MRHLVNILVGASVLAAFGLALHFIGRILCLRFGCGANTPPAAVGLSLLLLGVGIGAVLFGLYFVGDLVVRKLRGES